MQKTVKVNVVGIANLPLEELNAFQEDIKILTDERYEALKEEILEDGFSFSPHVFFDAESKAWILDGHQRRSCLERMKAEGYAIPIIPCMEVAAESLEHARRLVLAGTSQYGTFQPKKIVDFVKKTGLDGAAILRRFHMPEVTLKKLVQVEGHDRGGASGPSELPNEARSKIGDVYRLGDHRLMCGDATSKEHVEKLLAGKAPHLMVTDPPYGVEYSPEWRNDALRSDGSPIAGRAVGKVENDDKFDWRKAWELFPGAVAYVWHAGIYTAEVADSLKACGFEMRAQIIWAKSRFVISRGHYHWKHEPCWYAVRKGETGHWTGDRSQSTVWEINHIKSESGHGTQKPVEAMQKPMENNSKPGDVVYDPFLGSGTTLIAAQISSRKCFGMELNPIYVDVIIARWEKFTGQKAELIQ